MVLLRVDGPDNITHRIECLLRDAIDLGNVLRHSSLLPSQLFAEHFAQYSDLRQARPDVIVQICSYMSANVGYLNQTVHAVADHFVNHQTNEKHSEQYKPPASPNRRRNRKQDRSRLDTRFSRRVHGPHEEAISTRREIRIVHRALLCRSTPIRINTF